MLKERTNRYPSICKNNGWSESKQYQRHSNNSLSGWLPSTRIANTLDWQIYSQTVFLCYHSNLADFCYDLIWKQRQSFFDECWYLLHNWFKLNIWLGSHLERFIFLFHYFPTPRQQRSHTIIAVDPVVKVLNSLGKTAA